MPAITDPLLQIVQVRAIKKTYHFMIENAIPFLFQIAILIFSVVIHEVSHGYAALLLGDRTAYYEGRLTLNPAKHLDPFGSILLPVILAISRLPIIGWAKPVPYNPYNLKNQKWGPAIVGAAGPAANLILALFFGLAIRLVPNFARGFSGVFLLNFITIASAIVLVNIWLAVFNLVPIPPLDGSKVLFALMPHQFRDIERFLEQYGFILFLLFIFFFSGALAPAVIFLFRFITGTVPIF